MKKILLLPIAIAISSKVYAGKLATLGTLLLMATSAMGDPTATHNALTQIFCVATPPQQMYSLDEVKTDSWKTLPRWCSEDSASLVLRAHEEAVKSYSAECAIELSQDASVSVMVTRNLPHHIVQSFCDCEARGVKVLFKHSGQALEIFFKPDGTLESVNLLNENMTEYQGLNISYISANGKVNSRSCLSGTSDTLPPVYEAGIESLERQEAQRIIDNVREDLVYGSYDARLINDPKVAATSIQEVLAKTYYTSSRVEHSKTIATGTILTIIYMQGIPVDYKLFMRNDDGSTEVISLDRTLATQSVFTLQQNFDTFRSDVGGQTMITTSETDNNRPISRCDLFTIR
ncbi:MAG: hypothetical protein WCN27_01315 [Alphaproteobacteria bacterium]